MDWSDSVFREHVKYYGDVDYTPGNTIGDNGVVASKKYIAFRHSNKVGILSTDFDSNIAEKLAQGRKAEYGSKVYTTTKIDHLQNNTKGNIKALHFTPFNDDELLVGDSNGTLSLYDVGSSQEPKLQLANLSTSIYSLASHPRSSEFLVVGGDGNVNLIDLTKSGASIVDTKLDKEQVVRVTYSADGSVVYGITPDKLLFMDDPRTQNGIDSSIKLRFTPTNVVNLYGTSEIGVCGLTSFLEPMVVGYDVRKAGAGGQGQGPAMSDAMHDNFLFQQNYSHKQCTPYIHYDRMTQLLYVAFESCADLLCFNSHQQSFAKQALFHSVTDTFMSMAVLPKHSCGKRTINRILKFSKTRIQQLVHTRGGKLIYERIANAPRESVSSLETYMDPSNDALYDAAKIGSVVPIDFEEERKRAVSLYLHVAGKEPSSAADKYFDLKVSSTINCTLGLNLKSNARFAVFPAPTYGGGALGVIALQTSGRKKQAQLTAHSDKITTFDIGRRSGDNDALVMTGAADAKAIVSRIQVDANDASKIVGVDVVHTFKCMGRVTFVGFHPRIANVCVAAANKEGSKNECALYVFDYSAGSVLAQFACTEMFNITDVAFEPSIGLIAALSAAKGSVKLMDVRNGDILKTLSVDTFARDSKLFWAKNKKSTVFYTRLIALGFGKLSMRKFSVHDVGDAVRAFYDDNCVVNDGVESKTAENDDDDDDNDVEQKEEMDAAVDSHSFGVSNAIPIGYFDGDDGLFYVSSIGDRKIRVYEIGADSVKEMNASFQSTADIQGLSFALKQEVKVESVEMANCLKLSKDGEIAPVSFAIPRKRTEYFQDDLYPLQVVDVANTTIGVDWTALTSQESGDKMTVNITRIALKPPDMQLLSEAPEEEQTSLQKRRNSQVKAMEQERLKEKPQSTEQAFDQFSKIVGDAPTANRWDAVNVGTEVADDEWSD